MVTMTNQEEINNFLYQLYQDSSPASVSVECRRKHGLNDQNSFVYGEAHLSSFYDIINEAKPQPGEVFYDFGSGGGRTVLFTALSFPFAQSVGIEFLDDLEALAEKKLQLMYERLPTLTNFDANKLGEIKFFQGDITKHDVRNADVIYASSTCFDEKLMQGMARHLEEQVKVGTRVITCTKSLPSEQFKINKSQLCQMEWGHVTVFFQEKI